MATIKLPNSDQFDTMNGFLETLADNASPSYILSLVYPVGAIYISVVSTSPATLFGGTWVAFAAGKVLVGIDAGQTEFDTAEETGGAKTHALIAAELPTHTHDITLNTDPNTGAVNGTGLNAPWIGNAQLVSRTITSSVVGSGTAHNNLQPYVVVYMWKRTA